MRVARVVLVGAFVAFVAAVIVGAILTIIAVSVSVNERTTLGATALALALGGIAGGAAGASQDAPGRVRGVGVGLLLPAAGPALVAVANLLFSGPGAVAILGAVLTVLGGVAGAALMRRRSPLR